MGSKKVFIDNKWVVPYSPILSKAFKAHINVEYCNSVKSIKYICKYIYKGCDLAIFGIQNNSNENDEITRYQLGRYISTNEAVWKTLGFPIHDRFPSVTKLAVHLENGQRICYTKETAKSKIENSFETTLTAFFTLCKSDSFAKTLLYNEIPSYYTWNLAQKKFIKRKQGTVIDATNNIRKSKTIGRVYSVHPKNTDCFYLRMLLHHIKGPESFNDLKTINGIEFPTYREACMELGLLENDNHWNTILYEASEIDMPKRIRNLFVIILTHCNPSNPKGITLKILFKTT